MADAIAKKLDMSLDQIVDERKLEAANFSFRDASTSPRGFGGGKFRSTCHLTQRVACARAGYPSATAVGTPVPGAGEPGAGQRVYVGNLSWAVTWQMLKDHMRSAGDVAHVDVLESGGRSKGCAVVTFTSAAGAEEAVARLNDSVLDGRTIFVRMDREDRRARPNSGCRVYVGNLAWNVKWQDLKDHMKQAGRVVHADVLEEASGRSKGCGLVEYSTREEAQIAIAQLTNSMLGDRMIFVREDREPEGGSISEIVKRTRTGGAAPFPPGGVGYYPPPHFAHPHPFAPPPPLHHQFPHLPPYATPLVGGGGERQIFIGNLPLETHWKSLKELFSTVGPVERADMPEYPDGRVRGFGLSATIERK
ncbi:hypothetical protein PybrP1_001675 [[Pythium] brassicae (nom. inval.)]|nr:hypothetical protein PybrP1_001675 [[Pythium] brassicae (nom. inval.)]